MIAAAAEVVDSGVPRVIDVELTDPIDSWSPAVCGGVMDVFVEAAPSEYLSCSGSEQEAAACVQEGVAAFRTVHAQRIR